MSKEYEVLEAVIDSLTDPTDKAHIHTSDIIEALALRGYSIVFTGGDDDQPLLP